MSNPLRIALWCPEFERQEGGIQKYSKLLAEGLSLSPVGVECSVVPYRQQKASFAISAVCDLLLRRPELVIITHLHLARFSRLLRALNIPFWISLHGIECWGQLTANDVNSLGSADKILCVSRYTQERLITQHPEVANKTQIFPNHIEKPKAQKIGQPKARLDLGLPQNEKILLTVGRLSAAEKYKGHRELLAAVKALRQEGLTIHYVIAGDGDDRNALERLTSEMELGAYVTFLGRLKHEQLERAYEACDAFAMPSTGEGFGIVYLESMVRGKPVLAGNKDGSAEALLDGKLGLLVDPSNVHELRSGLRRLLTDCEIIKGDKLKELTLENFGPETLERRLKFLLADFRQRHER